jgi:hypothetical protein
MGLATMMHKMAAQLRLQRIMEITPTNGEQDIEMDGWMARMTLQLGYTRQAKTLVLES